MMTRSLAAILVVDDELAIREFMAEELRQDGYRVATAASGEEALAYLEQHPIDLVLLDLRMKGMDGLQTMAEIYRRPLPPEVIMLTAYATLDTAIAVIKQGGNDFLVKPCTHDELLQSVRQSLQRRSHSLQQKEKVRLIAAAASQLLQGGEGEAGAPLSMEESPPPGDASRYLRGRDLLLDRHAQTAWRTGQELSLTLTELGLLALFMSRPNHVWSYKELASEILGQEMSTGEARSALGTHLWRLRQKLGDGPDKAPYIINIRGRGYKFVS